MIESAQPATAEMETKAAPAPRRVANARWIEIHNVSWNQYTAMGRIFPDRPVPRMIYLDGSLTLVTTSQAHEQIKKRLGMLVTEVAVGLDIPHLATGQMTFRREVRQAGVEGDETYYIGSVDRVLGRTIDLEVDPPPDLAIEVGRRQPGEEGHRDLLPAPRPRGLGLRQYPAPNPGARGKRPLRRIADQRRLPVPDGGRDLRMGESGHRRRRYRMDVGGPPLGGGGAGPASRRPIARHRLEGRVGFATGQLRLPSGRSVVIMKLRSHCERAA